MNSTPSSSSWGKVKQRRSAPCASVNHTSESYFLAVPFGCRYWWPLALRHLPSFFGPFQGTDSRPPSLACIGSCPMQMRRTRSMDKDILLHTSSSGSCLLLSSFALNRAGYPSPINYYLFPLPDCPPPSSRRVTSCSSYFSCSSLF